MGRITSRQPHIYVYIHMICATPMREIATAKGNAEGNAKGNVKGDADANAKGNAKGNATDNAEGNAKANAFGNSGDAWGTQGRIQF